MKKGFTLIELLIVIVIIGILAGIVVGIVGTSANQKAQDAKQKANMHELQNALESYYVDHSEYPAAVADLAPDTGTKYITNVATYSQLTYALVGTGYKITYPLKNSGEVIDGVNVEAGATEGSKVYFVTSKQE